MAPLLNVAQQQRTVTVASPKKKAWNINYERGILSLSRALYIRFLTAVENPTFYRVSRYLCYTRPRPINW